MPRIPEPFAFANDSSKAGKRASVAIRVRNLVTGYELGIVAVHTRFDSLSWFLLDMEDRDESGLPGIIRQEPTFADAIAGYDGPEWDLIGSAKLEA